MAALGSSFASGPGIPPFAQRRAGRSERNYAHLTAAALGASLIDASVSGATTETILTAAQGTGRGRFAPQIESINSADELDLVTITVGGNDLGYVGSMLQTAFTAWMSSRPVARLLLRHRVGDPIESVTPQRVAAAAAGLIAVVEEAARRAPHARILLVDYLTIIGPLTEPSRTAPFTVDELAGFRAVGAELTSAFETAARESVAEFIPMAALSTDHAVGSADPWVTGFTFGVRARDGAPFHPNAAGMQAVSTAILQHLSHG
jgi:lysophospholipase L1-like esterase